MPTQLLYVGATDGAHGDPLELVALLSGPSGLPLAARPVTFMLGSQGVAAVTDANGVASAIITSLGLPGPTPLTATFAGDAETDGAQAAAMVIIARELTRVRLLGAEIVPVGTEGEVRAQLLSDEGDPVAGRTLSFTYGAATVSGTTGADGTAVALLAAPSSSSTPLTVSFAGDDYYLPASRSGTALPYQPSAFVIWGGNAGGLTVGQRVNFWGHSWAQQVTGGDYAGHSDFKGFAPTLPHFALCQPDAHTGAAPILMQDCWSTKAGNSFPPKTLPEHIGVLVATAIAKSDSRDYGNIAGFAVLSVEPGYGPSPGKPGWGTIVELSGPVAPGTALNASQTQPESVLPGETFQVSTAVHATGARATDVVVHETFTGATPATATASLGTIELGATVTTSFTVTTPTLPPRQAGESSAAYQSRLGAADGQLVVGQGTITFDDDMGAPGLPVDIRSTSRLDVPRLIVSLQAPSCAGPGTLIDYVVRVANVGGALAAAAQAAVTLPDGGIATVDFAALAPGESATQTVTWMVPLIPSRAPDESAADYTARLLAVDGRALGAAVAATWTDALGGSYGAVDQQATTIERLPILVAAAGSLPDLLPGQSAPLSVAVENIGTGNATGAQLQVGDNAPTTFALAAGASTTLTATATAPPLAPKGAGESDTEYRARLAASSGLELAFGWTLGWSTPEAGFGTLDGTATARQVLPLLDVALEAPAQAGVGDTITYTARLTNAGSAAAAAATASLTLPDGSTTELVFSALAAGESATQTATFTVPAPAPRGAGESNAEYVARLLALQAGLTASLSVIWTDVAANAYGPRLAGATTAVALPVLSLAVGTLPGFLPGQAQPLAITVQNLGAAAAAEASVRLANPDGTIASSTLALAAGASTTVTLDATAPAVTPKGAGESDAAYRARLVALSGSSLSFALALDWSSATTPFGTETAAVSATQVVPILDLVLEGPASVTPGQTLTATVRVTNAGTAAATTAAATVTKPDAATETVSFGAVAAGATATHTVTWSVPAPAPRGAGESNAEYVARLQALNATGLTTSVATTWTDGAGNALGAITQTLSTSERVPILVFTPGALTPFAPGQTQSLSIAVQNVGGADSSTATLTLTNPDGSTVPASFTLAAGASWSGPLNATAPSVAPKGAGESDADYRARLAAFERAALSFGLALDWNGPGASFGTENASVAGTGQVPILDVSVSAPAIARSGESVSYTVTLVNAGHAPTAATTVRFTGLGGTSQVLAAPAVLAPGASVQIPVAEVVPTGLPSGLALVRATAGWSDGAGSVYGEQSATASVTIQADPDLTISVARLPLALPGQSLPLAFTVRNVSAVDAASALLRVTRDGTEVGTATLPGLAAGAVTAVTVNVTAPALAPKGADESDATYRQRVLAVSDQALAFDFALNWTSAGGGSYGPRGGTTSTYVVAPLVGVSLTAPTTARSGEALTYTVRLANAGHADAAGLALTLAFPDGTTQPITMPATLPRGASLEIPVAWTSSAQQESGPGIATATIAWTDANGAGYGPQSNTATTTFARGNQPPQVTVGAPQTITLPALATLTGTATDDGQPAALSYSWVKVSGPAEPTILDPRAVTTQVTFGLAGAYVFRFTASDSQLTASATTTVTVVPRSGDAKTFRPTEPVPGETLLHVVRDGNQLRLGDRAGALNRLWVSVSPKGTLVKIDTDTGQVLGEYKSAPDSCGGGNSRVAVDLNGNAWNTNRTPPGGAVHVGLLENGQCVDRNGNGRIDTSTGLGDVRPWPGNWPDCNSGMAGAQDECILHYVRTTAQGTRHLSVDPNNDVWVSGSFVTGAGAFDLIDGRTGVIKRREPSVGYGGYGGVFDQNGVIWSARPLLRWDTALPLTGPNGGNWRGYGHNSYGICIDSQGNVWNTEPGGTFDGSNGIHKFAPDGTHLGKYWHGRALAQGCTVDHNDDVWVAHSWSESPGSVGHLTNDGTFVGNVDMPGSGGPTGVAVDDRGKVWVTNAYSRKATRIDPSLGPIGGDGRTTVGAVDLETPTLSSGLYDYLYNYSDMTGSTLTGAPQSGTWSFVYDTEREGAPWGSIAWTGEVYGDGALAVSAASSADSVTFTPEVPACSGQALALAPGRYLKVTVRFKRSTSGESPRLYDLTVATSDYQLEASPNAAPVVNLGADRATTLPNPFRLSASVRDDAHACGQTTVSWSKVSGPGAVTFATPTRPATDITFGAPGAYVLRLTANDGGLTASDEVTVTVLAANLPPIVNPGPNLAVALPGPATLLGTVQDDGLPTSALLTIAWSTVSGPGTVAFSSPSTAQTDATFSAEGAYVLRLSASDSDLGSAADVVVVVSATGGTPPDNLPPTVGAGPGQTIWQPASATLHGTASDDGLPAGSSLALTWSKVSGPDSVVFGSPTQAITTATFGLAGAYLLRLTACDSVLCASADTTVTVNPRSATNAAPAISVDPAAATLNLPLNQLTITALVTDDGLPAGSLISTRWEQVSGPGVVAFGSASPGDPYGTVAAFPRAGEYLLRLEASDGLLGNSMVVPVTVLPDTSNHPPEVSAGSPLSVTWPALAELLGSVRDDGLPINGVVSAQWSKVSGPGTVQFANPLLVGTEAAFSEPGNYVLRLTASDGALSAFSEVVVTSAGNMTPVVSAGPAQTLAYPQRTATLVGSATDDGLPSGTLSVAWSKVSGLGGVTFSAPTQTTTDATFSLAGTYVVRLSATDGEKTGTSDLTVTVGAPTGAVPSVALLAPADGSVVTAPADVIGSVSEGEWLLDYRAGGDDSAEPWTTIATGTTPVANAALGTFDPTLLLNGTYTLRLTATTAAGSASDSLALSVDKNFKVGNFTVSFTDLQVPVGTLPITLTRTYDSRDKRVGDFGVGWSLGISNVRVEKTHALGKYWTQTSTGGWFPSYCLEPTKAAFVTITFPDGKVFKFRTGATPSCQQFYPLEMVDLAFTPEPGTYGTLAALDVPAVLVEHSEGPTDLVNLDLMPVDSRRFRLTTDDGTVFVLSQDRGVESITDRNGNSLTISAAGVIHSSGKSVAFTRDVLGRITQITDPAGQMIAYEYNAAGDLVAVVDRTAARTTFAYNGRHDLLDLFDPRGIRPVRNEYDAGGRLLRHIDPYGKVIEYTHAIGTRQELITDRLGGVRVLEYDYRGNVVRETDPEGKVTTRTFDARDNRTSETDPEGRTTTWVWDGIDNLISTTDPLGHTSSTTYNARRQVLAQTDARGGVTSNAYDGNGNLTATTDALGETTRWTYDGVGNQRSETDARGHVTAYDYDGSGNRTRQTDALGNVTTFTYDANGNQLTQARTRTTASGTVTETTATEYDGSNRVTRATAADGSITRTVYNSLGKPEQKIDALGRSTSYGYDDLGRLATTTYPDGTTETATYDAEGRRLTSTDRGGRTTAYAYDGLGRLTKTTVVDGSFTTSTYDGAGKLIASTDARGQTTTYAYDGAGRQTKVTDPLGNQQVSAYDAAGNRTAQTDAKGQTTIFLYDLGGRLTRTVFPDGTARSSAYDALGRRVSDTDQAGQVTQFGYDALGRLTSVTDAAGGVTTYGYDEAGNRVRQTDAEGRTTTFAFDALGREVSRTLPDGSSEQKGYDPAGNQTSRTDFAGRTTTYAFDAADRLLSRTYPDSSTVAFTYSATGRRLTATDARGTTTYGYNSRDRLTSLTYPDGRALEYAWDNAGNRTSLTAVLGATRLTTALAYDDAGRLQTVTDPNGQAYGHTYDPNGNRASLTHPNGVTTAYTFDANNRLAMLATAHSSGPVVQSYAFTLGPTGNRQRIDEGDGTVRGYGYDVLYRLVRETVSGGPLAAYEKQFGYDRVGNRLSQVTTGAGAATVAYAYDTRDRLQTENTLAYSFDVNGNLVGKDGVATYVWDFDNRLIEVHLASGTLVEHQYDVDGTRVRTKLTPPTGPPTDTNYLVDTAGALSHVVAETDGAGALQASYVRGDDLLAIHRPGQVRYVHADGLGSIRRLTDEAGAVTDAYTYTAFGETLDHTGTDPQPYQFAGEPYDPNSGLYHNRARWLDPRVGRFVSTDPLEFALVPDFDDTADPRVLHRYLYARSAPPNFVDPSGLFDIMESKLVTAVSGILASISTGVAGQARIVLQQAQELSKRALPVGLKILNGNAKWGLEHILRRHGARSIEWGGKFSRGMGNIEIRGLIQKASRSSGSWTLGKGKLVLETNMHEVIGNDAAGRSTEWLRVVTDLTGRVITAYPITPGAVP